MSTDWSHGKDYKGEMQKNLVVFFFFFQAEDGIRDLVRSRGLGDVYRDRFGPNAST